MNLDPNLNPNLEPQLRNGTEFVCNLCCGNGQMYYDRASGCVIWNCPDHMRLVLKDGKVLEAQPLGVRQ